MRLVLAAVAALVLAGSWGAALAQEDGRLAVIETGHGSIVIEFFPGDAPNHVANFASLAESGFYDGTLFHRIIPGFMIQGGDPNTVSGDPATWGTGGPEHRVDAEFNDISHQRGIVSMARSADPNSAGSQFFIVHADSTFLDGQYTAFGRIATEESFETLDRIAASGTGARDIPVDPESVRITSVTMVDRSEVQGLVSGAEERLGSQTFESEEFGVSFDVPAGWAIQRLTNADGEKENPDAPDVAVVGPLLGGSTPPQITLTVKETSKSFDDVVSETDERVNGLAITATLNIVSRETGSLNGAQTYTVVAKNSYLQGLSLVDVTFREVTIYGDGMLYIMTYANDADNYDAQEPLFEAALESFTFPKAGGGGCLIATAAYGTELAPQVQMLRELRDNTVMSTGAGSSFMEGFNGIYYSFSPYVADLQREHPALRDVTRALITPMVHSLGIMSLAEGGSEAHIVGLGAAVIALNLGMYAAAPAAVVLAARRASR